MYERIAGPAFLLLAAASCQGVMVSEPEGSAGGNGTSGDGGADAATMSERPPSAYRVLISEIMYHPIADDAPDSTYEFLEIYNAMKASVALDGWQIDGQVRYAFPAGTSLAPGQYLAVAKDRQKLAPIYQTPLGKIIGDFAGELANGGGWIMLVDAVGALADEVTYDDKLPWPLGPDALGAGADWFEPGDPRSRTDQHQGKGMSLERISFDVAADEISNWAPSKLDGATPGQANAASGSPAPIVVEWETIPKSGQLPVRKNDDVTIRAKLSALGKVDSVELEYFVDDPQKIGEATTVKAMVPGPNGFEITLPPQPDSAIVRYRLWGDRGAGRERVSPRPSDPNAWHAYFVEPAVDTRAPVYHLFISSADWGQMWLNPGGCADDLAESETKKFLEDACTPNPGFDADVPAVFASDGVVHDVRVRYQGGQFSRLSGEIVKNWPVPGPSKGPNPPTLLGWRIKFPTSSPFDTGKFAGKRTAIDVKKANYASCQAFPNYLATRLMESAGIPSQRVRFVRYYVNGAYYGYMADQGPVDGNIALRSEPGVKVQGDLFKASSQTGGQGPWFKTDAAPVVKNPLCPQFEIWEMYQYSYERQTHGWKTRAIAKDPQHPPDDVQKLLEGLEAARLMDRAGLAGETTTNREAFLKANFDLDRLRDYIAIRNWAGTWDDNHHNYYLYKKTSDGKWFIIGWDYESEYGAGKQADQGRLSAAISFYLGEEGDKDNYPMGFWNRIKDAYLKCFKKELDARLRALAGVDQTLPPAEQILSTESIHQIVEELRSTDFSMDDWNAAAIVTPPLPQCVPAYDGLGQCPAKKHTPPCDPARGSENQCRPSTSFTDMKNWAIQRNAALRKQVLP